MLLVLVGSYTLFKPDLGKESIRRFHGARHTVLAMLTFLTTWNDFFWPSAKAKIANFATNLGALTVFLSMGLVLFKVGLVIASANLIGGYAGARTAVAKGSGFVRAVFVAIVSAFILKIGGSLLGWWP